MKMLRNHLEQARREYRSVHYRGDLASDVLSEPQRVLEYGRHRRISPWIWLGGASAAAAAILAVVIFFATRPARQVQLAELPSHPDNEQADVSLGSIPAVSTSELTDVELDPPAISGWSVSMPSLSFSDQQSSPADDSTAPGSPTGRNSAYNQEEAVL